MTTDDNEGWKQQLQRALICQLILSVFLGNLNLYCFGIIIKLFPQMTPKTIKFLKMMMKKLQ